MNNYILSTLNKICMLCIFLLLIQLGVEGQKLISTSQSEVSSVSSSEDMVTVTLSIDGMPSGFSLLVQYVDVEYNLFNTYKTYKVISPNMIQFRLKKNYFKVASSILLRVKTNVGTFDVPIRQSGYNYNNRIEEGRVLGYDPESKLYYDSIIALPNFNASLVQVLIPYWVNRPRMVWWRAYNNMTGWESYYPESADTLRVAVYATSYFTRADGRDYGEESLMPGVHVDMDVLPVINRVKICPSSDSVKPGEKFELVPTKRFAPFYKGTYTWEKKEKNGTWTLISEASAEALIVEKGIKQNTIFRRGCKVMNTQLYSNEVSVCLKGLGGGIIGCLSDHVERGSNVTILSIESPNTTDVTYSWERKVEGNDTWSLIAGATGETYTETNFARNTWYRRKAYTGVGNFYSNVCFVWTNLRNQIKITTYLEKGVTETGRKMIADLQYQDGIGRVIQDIQVKGMPSSLGTGDIIIPHDIGLFGREEKAFLPYSKLNNNGTCDETAFAVGNWSYLEGDDRSYAYSLTEYDNSPLDRVVKQTGTGKNWQVNGRGVTTAYLSNGANQVKILGVDIASGALTYAGIYYPANTLSMIRVTDEDDNVTEEFRDREGNVLLSVMVNSGVRHETYHVYDDRGLLRYVLSPEASAGLTTGVNTSLLDKYAFYYEYDGCGRMVVKRLPGCDPVYMVYDKRDRLVMSQDGNQREADVKKWSYSLYDNQNRVVETGEVVLTGSVTTHAGLRSDVSTKERYVPVGNRIALQYTLYDTYTATTQVPVLSFEATSGYASKASSFVTGLVTSVNTRVLGTNTWLTTTTYYDDRCRVIQTVSDNLHGGLSRVDVKYDFVGNVIQQRECHAISGSQTDILESENAYDDRGRLLSVTTKLNNGTPATVNYTYDAVGRLVSRKLGSVTETMTYNARGWLTGKESTSFKMKLRYESPQVGTSGRYNGNISEWEWQQGANAAMMYHFSYDDLNRLKGSVHYQRSGSAWSALSGNNAFNESGLSYDKNGNILTLTRGGSAAVTQVYTYTGNQLTGLSRDDVTGTYRYDKNGNLVNDSRKNLNLTYNVLNLLSAVKTGTTPTATYSYLADGVKLGVVDGSNNGFCYLGSLTYVKNGNSVQLESGLFGGGRIVANASSRVGNEVRYFLTDHLGSVRVIVDQSGSVKERNDYYPFGGRYAVSGGNVDTGSRWKYNGKEDQVTGGLGWLDYGARMYDWELGRWFGMDPKSENFFSWSPYHYCSCNPLLFIDLYGEEGLPYFSKLAYGNNPFFNLLKMVPNVVTNILNGGVSMINSGITTVETIYGSGLGSYASGLGNEMKGLGVGIWNNLSSTASYYANTPFRQQMKDLGNAFTSAENWENTLTLGASLYLGSVASSASQSIFMSAGRTSSMATSTLGLSNRELIQKSAQLAERAIGGKGPVVGIAKHKYATSLLDRYQNIYGNRGLLTNFSFNNGIGNRGILDIFDTANGVIYDYKFGKAMMSTKQYNKYFNNFQLPIEIVRP